MRLRKILLVLSFLFVAYALWLAVEILTFRRHYAPRYAPWREYEGVYHVHSLYSDGRRDVDSIAREAKFTGLDFLIFTDHGSPNRACLQSQGWKEGVLMLAGSELSVSRGHLVALGFKTPEDDFPQNAEEAIREISRFGGFSIVAHPFSLTPWTWGESTEYDGLELINGNTAFRKNLFAFLPYLPALLLKPDYALLRTLDPPAQNLRKWDELNRKNTLFGYFATDAHLLYRPVLSLLRIHLVLKEKLSSDFETARNQVFETLRSGKFYNVIEAAARARGFRFYAQKGDRVFPMGKTVTAGLPLTLTIQAPFPFDKDVHLLRDGERILISSRHVVSYEAERPGTYRVEVYLKERTPLRKDIPWLVSNPIFLREEKE